MVYYLGMKVGDILKIKGSLGFRINPEMEVLEIKGGLVQLRSIKDDPSSLLGGEYSWYGVDIIEKKL